MKFLTITPGHTEKLSIPGSPFKAAHLFDKTHIDAVNAALGAGRPLLIRGEPGIGKSQLARATAKALKWAYLPFVADARTESRDLLYSFDAVARLADAQAKQGGADDVPISKYLAPGVLWWAFDWETAETQAGEAKVPPPPQPDNGDRKTGSVVLIDEIDKADTDVPNGLLEALGVGQFAVRDRVEPVRISGPAPLVIITTNEERMLPDAFVRRCLVLHLALPIEENGAKEHFKKVGKAHFGSRLKSVVLDKAAEMVAKERKEAYDRHWRPLPGQAEYIDLLHSVVAQAGNDADWQVQLLDSAGRFILAKDPGAAQAYRSESSKR